MNCQSRRNCHNRRQFEPGVQFRRLWQFWQFRTAFMHPLIYDWNQTSNRPARTVILNDETLRDGLQSPSVTCPTIEQKLQILHLIDRLGIDTADLGLPGAGPHVVKDVERLAREIE